MTAYYVIQVDDETAPRTMATSMTSAHVPTSPSRQSSAFQDAQVSDLKQ